jgi:sporulation protein YlmC with PRC-barrel domain
MANREICLELLLGKRVLGVSGKHIGRLEEICAELKGGECLVHEYHVGSYAVWDRLSALSIGRAILRIFGATKAGGGYRVPWDKLDLTDVEKPRLRCAVKELEKLNIES